MSGKTLYDKHCAALKRTERYGYEDGVYGRRWPTRTPPAWQFAGTDMRNYYNELAKLITPRRSPVPSTKETS